MCVMLLILYLGLKTIQNVKMMIDKNNDNESDDDG